MCNLIAMIDLIIYGGMQFPLGFDKKIGDIPGGLSVCLKYYWRFVL